MKRGFLLVLLALAGGCSVEDERALAERDPRLAPTTRAMESLQSRLDPIAQQSQQGAAVVQRSAEDLSALGVPGAGAVALIAAIVGSLLGAYNERRRGTRPLNTALAQIVRSVECAFPNRTESQKLAMASAQDQKTRALVSSIKGT
jgi:hypothetical protein